MSLTSKQNQDFPETWLALGLVQGKNEMILEYMFIPESKEWLNKLGGHIKMTLESVWKSPHMPILEQL